MRTTHRRAFLKQTGSLAAGAATISLPTGLRAAGANDKLVLGLIGPGGIGAQWLKSFSAQPDVALAYVCDPDANRLAAAVKTVETATGQAPTAVKDMRRIFDVAAVDAVIIATPDHWHAPAAILACDAGKHVYVEKPCAHNIREGRLLVEAARRTKRIVQTGTQSRSVPHVMAAMKRLREGLIGDVLVAKAWNSQLRRNIGKAKPAEPPAHLDYDLWLGPAPHVPYQANMLPGSWRWFRPFGSGDIGNDGVHDIDIARWGLGVETHPTRIAALGGKYFFDDDQQFPDTQTVAYEYAGPDGRKRQLIYEQRIWSPYVQETHENGDAFYGTQGMLILGKMGGWQAYGPRNKLLEEMKGDFTATPHHRNFLDCIKTGQPPNAAAEIGHLSATLSHLGNIATRVGRVLHFDPATERIVGDDEAHRLVRREYRPAHWATPQGV